MSTHILSAEGRNPHPPHYHRWCPQLEFPVGVGSPPLRCAFQMTTCVEHRMNINRSRLSISRKQGIWTIHPTLTIVSWNTRCCPRHTFCPPPSQVCMYNWMTNNPSYSNIDRYQLVVYPADGSAGNRTVLPIKAKGCPRCFLRRCFRSSCCHGQWSCGRSQRVWQWVSRSYNCQSIASSAGICSRNTRRLVFIGICKMDVTCLIMMHLACSQQLKGSAIRRRVMATHIIHIGIQFR